MINKLKHLIWRITGHCTECGGHLTLWDMSRMYCDDCHKKYWTFLA